MGGRGRVWVGAQVVRQRGRKSKQASIIRSADVASIKTSAPSQISQGCLTSPTERRPRGRLRELEKPT